MRQSVALVALAASIACVPQKSPTPDHNPGNFATAENGWYRGDLHFHTRHSEDATAQGGDDLGLALRIADSYRDPDYLAAFPEREGDGLDFIVVTDHRTDAALHDPDFKHDHLILIGGEEYGSSGHANIIGLKQHITQDPVAGETRAQRQIDAMKEAHEQGALFSINHPTQENRWVWDVELIDAVEVWNATWSAFWGGSSEDALDEDVAGSGHENPYIRQAIRNGEGGGANDQARWFWYGLLSRGKHVPLIGGSDRHMLLMPGLPTTYVRKTSDDAFAAKKGREIGADGIVESLREGATFVSSSPHGPQIELEAQGAGGERHAIGSRLEAGTWTIHGRVTRAKGGKLQLVGGPLVPGDGPAAPEVSVLHEQAIDGGDVRFTWTWQVPQQGGWLHALVLVPRIVESFPEALEGLSADFDKLPPANGKGAGSIVRTFGLIADPNLLTAPELCDPATWDLELAQCVPADDETLPTFFLPEALIRLLNTWFEDGQPTDWSMGAITSAFLAGAE